MARVARVTALNTRSEIGLELRVGSWFDLESIDPDRVEAMEVFYGSLMPGRYLNQCGVILVWLKRRSLRMGRRYRTADQRDQEAHLVGEPKSCAMHAQLGIGEPEGSLDLEIRTTERRDRSPGKPVKPQISPVA
jgi:hypothetical protein